MKNLVLMFVLVATFANSANATGEANDAIWGWRHAGEKNIFGNIFDVYENQDGEQAMVKRRTPRSPEEPEPPTDANLPTRQSIFEWGIGFGYNHASKASTLWKKNGVQGAFGELYDGSETKLRRDSAAFDINLHFRPPVSFLKRLTVGVNAPLNFGGGSSPENSKNIWDYEKNIIVEHQGDRVTYPQADILNVWQYFAEWDIIYRPGPERLGILSAGYYRGVDQALHFAGYDEHKSEINHDDGVQVRYRWVFEGFMKTDAGFYVLGKASRKGSVRFTAGMLMMFGPPNAPQSKVEK